ncbi:SRPBCC family protein [Methyloceanibacter sp.]|uniref:SRPBCC family protein n=1 Tax=Methyloceanibacter sp. TaxID=1965321 RepID=UPI003D6D738E
MGMLKSILVALAVLIAWSAAAEAVDVEKRREAPGKPDEIWKLVGGFCDIKQWHPAVADCVETKEGDITFRTLTLKDGGKIKEKLTGTDATSYSYEIVESPLPVKNYKATLRIGKDDEEDRIEIVWQASFDAEGASDEDAKKKVTDIFNAGLTGIKEKANTAHYGSDDSKAPEGDKDDNDNK